MSFNSYNLDTKFGKAEEYINEIKEICEKENIIHTIQGAEPIGPKKLTDIMVIAPCSGNTIAKLSNSYSMTGIMQLDPRDYFTVFFTSPKFYKHSL